MSSYFQRLSAESNGGLKIKISTTKIINSLSNTKMLTYQVRLVLINRFNDILQVSEC